MRAAFALVLTLSLFAGCSTEPEQEYFTSGPVETFDVEEFRAAMYDEGFTLGTLNDTEVEGLVERTCLRARLSTNEADFLDNFNHDARDMDDDTLEVFSHFTATSMTLHCPDTLELFS